MHRKASAALDVSLRIEKKKFRPLVTWVCRSFPQPAARHGGAQGRCRGLCALRRGTPRRGQPRAGAAARVPQRARAGPCAARAEGLCSAYGVAARVAGCARPRGAGARRRVVETVRLARCRRAARGAWAIPPNCKHRPPSNSWLPRGGVAPSAAAGREGGEARCAEEVVARSSASAGQCRNGREGMRCLCNQRPHARAPRSSQPPDPGCLRPHSHGPVGPGNEKP